LITDALANLATAQAADQKAFCQLVTTNTDLAEQLKSAMEDISSLKNLVLSQQQNQQDSNPGNNHNHSHNPNPYKRRANNNYCWSHGFKVAEDHTSKNCQNTRFGHQKDATRENTMGGSKAGKRF
jgi:hypothetical protein